MSIYLGSAGHIELARPTTDWLPTTINNGDINTNSRRLSFDLYGVADTIQHFITGDRLEFRSDNSSDTDEVLGFIPAAEYPNNTQSFSITRYAHIDAAGGIRLYRTFGGAINGKREDAIELQKLPASFSGTQKIKVRVSHNASNDLRCLGQVTSYEIVSERENIDITSLNQLFRQQYEAGLIQGSGRISAFWEFKYNVCGQNYDGDRYNELPYFLAATVLRLEQGATFTGRFYLYSEADGDQRDVLYYDCPKCVITNCAVSVEPTSIITADIDFVVSGRVSLKYGMNVDLLSQEGTVRETRYIVDEAKGKPHEMISSGN